MCDLIECKECKHKCKNNITDTEVEKLWEELEDVLFIEDSNSGDSCELVLASDWQGWNKGTTRDEIWRWFNQHYSKGLEELLWLQEKW